MSRAPGLEIESVCLENLKPSPVNPRTHTRKQIDKICKSIKKFGFTNPILIDEDNMILAGHGRYSAATKLGMKEVPCRRLVGMSEAEKAAYIIADNALGEQSMWHTDKLAAGFDLLIAADFELEYTGFDTGAVDKAMLARDTASRTGRDTQDVIPELQATAVTRLGDGWTLGPHRLLCGDSKDLDQVRVLMGRDTAAMIFTDGPYNLPIDGYVRGKGSGFSEFAEASGEMSSSEFEDFLTTVLKNGASVCRDGAIVYACMDWKHAAEIIAAGDRVFSEQKNLCVWTKANAGMGTFYRSQHELVFVWKVGSAPHTNNFGLGEGGRHRSNVWKYPGVNSFGKGRGEALEMHPTVKPVALVMDAILDVTQRKEIVLDLFGGSGTTLIAAHMVGRTARLMEIDPRYCDVTIRRFEKLTGEKAVLASDGRTFDEVAEDRAEEIEE